MQIKKELSAAIVVLTLAALWVSDICFLYSIADSFVTSTPFNHIVLCALVDICRPTMEFIRAENKSGFTSRLM